MRAYATYYDGVRGQRLDDLPAEALHEIILGHQQGTRGLVAGVHPAPTHAQVIEQARIIISLKEQGLL